MSISVSKKRMMLFFATATLLYMAASFAHPVTPTMFTNLGLGSYMFGYALASMMVVNFCFSPFWGKISDYISSRRALLIACIGYAVGQIFFGLAQTELGFILARGFTGIFTGGSMVCGLTYVVNVAKDDKERGQYLTIMATIQTVAGAFGFFIGGMLGEIETYVAIIAQVICLVLSGVLFFFVCDDDAKVNVKTLKAKKVLKEANPFAAFVASKAFMSYAAALVFGMCLLQNLGMTAFDQTFNYYIRDQFGFSSGYNGAIKGAMGVIALVANSTICMYLIKRTNIKKSIIYVLGICSGTMLSAIMFSSVVPFIIANVGFYAMNSISVPLLQNIAVGLGKEDNRSLLMGFYNAMKTFGGILGALFAGTLYSVKPELPFIFGFAAFALATVLAVAFYAKVKKEKQG